MRLLAAEIKLRNYIRLNINNSATNEWYFVNSVRWKIICLSHEVFLSRTKKGHLIRQRIRKILWYCAKREVILANSGINLILYKPPYEAQSIFEKIFNFFRR